MGQMTLPRYPRKIFSIALALGKFIDEFVQVPDFPHQGFFDRFDTDAAEPFP